MRRIPRFMTRVLGVIYLLTLLSRPCSAQVTAGFASISGLVHDSSGAMVPDAQVVVSNPSKGVRISLHTSGGGVFNAPSLLPSSGYNVTVEKQGFTKYEVKDIVLEVGQDLNLVVTLTVATATAQIEVIGSAPAIDETKTDVSQVIGSQQILDLPINGRRVDTFVLLTPGVTNDGNFGLLTFRGVANGNSFLLDGNDSTEQFYGENNGRTRILSQISQDAVQEFQVVSANFSAEYGNAMGGVVNTVTRSGTNDYHGTVFYFYRNQDFDARDPFATVAPDDWRLQSGFSFGGPIIKNKLFFFVNGDFSRHNFPIVDSYIKNNVINTTTEQFDAYNPPSVPLGCGAPAPVVTAAQCSAINALLPRFFGTVPRNSSQDLAFARLDYHLTDNNILSASFNYMHFVSPNGLQQTLIASTSGVGVNSNGNDFARVRNGKFTWTSIHGSNLVNSFRYGYDTDLQGDNLNPSLNGVLGFLDVSAAGVTLGAVNYLPRVEPNETRNELADDVSWTKGRHIIKFGMDFATTNDYSYFIQFAHGSYSYSNLTAFAADFSGNTTNAKDWNSYTQTFGNPALNTRINYYGFYLEDQWRATNKLTVNYGARYEYSQLPQAKQCNPLFAPLTCHVDSQSNNLMPRIGLAYRINDKTVVRAGYGLFFARIMGATLQDLFTGNGVTTEMFNLSATKAAQLACGPVFPAILAAPPTCPGVTPSIQFASPGLKTPYTEQGLVAIEHDFGHKITATASYIWSRGIHLYSVFDTNLPPPTNTTMATYQIDNAAGAAVGTYTTPVLLSLPTANGRPNTNFGGMYEDTNGVSSYYTGFTLQIQKRFSHGFMADISYTWSHEYDDGQGYGQDNQNIFLSNANAWLVNGNYRLDMGDGLEDQPQRLVASFIWAPTFTQRSGGFYKYVVNNWEFASIMTVNSDRPYGSPTISVNGTPVAGMFSNFSINGYGLSGRVPFLPVDSVLQPASYRADLRISKIVPIGERYRLYFNLEVFNVSNTWSPTGVFTSAYTETGTCGAAPPKNCQLIPVSGLGQGSSDALNPDGTEARRLQASVRFTF